ncbi:unnamed protein product, partial [Enterobius vermicularis]|uniref:TIL domain-containing protein n=1 Tax=Enterobius vermicularis TaxID=51028 RepID=A0A0N4V638_ENTVE
IVALLTTDIAFVNGAPQVCLTCVIPCTTCEGQWGEWGPWSDCTFQYGVWGRTRERSCRGANCEGARDEAIRCDPPTTTTLPPPVWGEWSAWTICSASCGGGTQTRTRLCIRVAGQTLSCSGPSSETRNCNPQPCCNWGQWGPWSSCSVTCGNGVSIRSRECSCSQGCQGESIQEQTCTNAPCQESCNTGCSSCCSISICASCVPGQPCASTCFPEGSSSVPTIGGSTIPTINSGAVPTIPTIGSGDVPTIPTIGSGDIPTIPTIGSGALPTINSDLPVIGSGNIPQIRSVRQAVQTAYNGMSVPSNRLANAAVPATLQGGIATLPEIGELRPVVDAPANGAAITVNPNSNNNGVVYSYYHPYYMPRQRGPTPVIRQ